MGSFHLSREARFPREARTPADLFKMSSRCCILMLVRGIACSRCLHSTCAYCLRVTQRSFHSSREARFPREARTPANVFKMGGRWCIFVLLRMWRCLPVLPARVTAQHPLIAGSAFSARSADPRGPVQNVWWMLLPYAGSILFSLLREARFPREARTSRRPVQNVW